MEKKPKRQSAIKRKLVKLGMTQKELARRMGVSEKMVSIYCRDDYILLPDDIRTHQIREILQMDLNEFYS